MGTMLEIQGLTKQFGQFTAVDNISFSVASGEVLGFLGPNGSGKSTTMKMVTGFLSPTSGTALVCGQDVTRDPIAVKRHIGYLPEGAPLYEDMTPSGMLSFIADVRGLSGADRRNGIDNAVNRLQLDEVFNQQKHHVRELIAEMSKDKAIVISTHVLEEVDAVCARAIVIARGKMVADGTPAELERRSSYYNAVSVRLHRDHVDGLRNALDGIGDIERLETGEDQGDIAHVVVMSRNGATIIDTVNARMKDRSIAIEQLYVERGRLEDVFRQITGDEQGRT